MCGFLFCNILLDLSLNEPRISQLLSFVLCFFVFSPCFCMLRTDSVSLSQEGELDSSLSHDLLPSTCPDHPVVSSNAFHAADTHQEEGKTINHTFF